MNANKALWEKGDFTRIAESMRESGEALVDELGHHRRAQGARPRLRRRDHRVAGGSSWGPTSSASTSPATWSRPATRARRALGLTNLQVPGGRRVGSARARRRELRPRRQHLRRDVRSQAVRRGQGDGPGDQAGRPDRDGELDPQRPDPGRPDPEDQLLLLAAAAGGLRQPDDLGRGGRRDRALHGSRESPRSGSRSSGTPTRSTTRARRRSWWPSSGPTTGRP